MPKFWRFIKWSAIGLGLTLLLALVALALYVRTDSFSHWVREQAVAAINESIRGTVAIERFEGTLWGDLTLDHVVLRHEGEEILAIPRLKVAFDLWPLIWGRVQIAGVDAAEARAVLIQSETGEWNVAEALAPRRPEEEAASAWVVLINSFTMRNGDIALYPDGPGAEPYRMKDFSLTGQLLLRPARLAIDVREVSGLLTAPSQPDARLKGALAYQQSGAAPGRLTVKDFWLVSRNSQVKVNAQITQSDPLSIKARALVPKLAAADIAHYVPDWPVRKDLAGSVAIEGSLDAVTGNVEVTAAGAKVDGKFRADLTAEMPRYTTRLTLSGFDLRRWLEDPDFSGVVGGTAEVSGNGFELAAIAAKASLEVRRAAAHGWSLGDVSLDGRLENRVASVDGDLKSPLGGATWSGKIVLDDNPAYEVALAVKNLDVERALPARDALRGSLNLEGVVKGTGLSLADMNTRAEFQILPSTLGPVQVTQGGVDATLSNRRLRIARAALGTAESTLTVAGELGLEATIGGTLDYRLRMTDVSPWLSLAGRKGSGSLNVIGQAQGNLADLSTEGTAQLSRLQLDGVAVRDGTVKFALQGSSEQVFPRGVVTARLAGVDAGVALERIDVAAKLAREPSPSIALQLNAQDRQARRHTLSGLVEFLPDAVVARLRQAELGSPSGTWTLVSPASVTQRDDEFLIEGVSLRSDGRQLSLDGRFAFTGPQDLTLNIDRFSLETLAAFLPEEPDMTGLLAAEARITGTAAAPDVSVLAQLSDASIAGQAYAGARAELKYKDKLASLSVAVQQDATHALTGAGTFPISLSWHDGWRADFGDDMEFRLRSTGVSLAFLNAWAGESVENIGGEVSLDVLARGSIKQPDVQGTFQLRDGRVKILPLGIDVAAMAAVGSLDSRKLIVRELSARAQDGEIRGSGALALTGFDVSAVKLSLSAKRWPAIATERYQVRVGGQVDVQGSLEAPKVTGKLTVTEGSLRPDLAFLERSEVPLQRDETIVVIKNNSVVRSPPGQAAKPGAPAKDDWFANVSLDLDVNAPGNLWIRHPDLVAELSGKIQARKAPQREIDLIGRIAVVRGWMAFQGRRLQLARGVIEFTGGDGITPSLDFVAQYRVQGYQVQVLIGGTTEKPVLTLSSEPRLEQADILALLIFGKPLGSLNEHEQGSLQQSALSITSGFVAATVAQSVSRALGLDALGLDIGDVSFSGGRVGFGRYVGPGAYVSVSQQLAGEQGREVALEYQITPDWKISTSSTTTGSSGIDIIWHKRY